MKWLVSGGMYRRLVYGVVGECGIYRRLVYGVFGGRDVQKAII